MAYFPNSSAGETLDQQCSDCKIPDDAPCPVLLAQMVYNYEQVGNPKLKDCLNTLIDEKGNCQMKPLIDKLDT